MNYKPLSNVEEVSSISSTAKMLIVDGGEVKKAPVSGGVGGIQEINGKTGPIVTINADDVDAVRLYKPFGAKHFMMLGEDFKLSESQIDASNGTFVINAIDGVNIRADDVKYEPYNELYPRILTDNSLITLGDLNNKLQPLLHLSKTITIKPSDWYAVEAYTDGDETGITDDDLLGIDDDVITTKGLPLGENIFQYSNGAWKLGNQTVQLSAYGIEISDTPPVTGDKIIVTLYDSVFSVWFPIEMESTVTYSAIPIRQFVPFGVSGDVEYSQKRCGIFSKSNTMFESVQSVSIGCPRNSDGTYTPPTVSVDVLVTAFITTPIVIDVRDRKHKKNEQISPEPENNDGLLTSNAQNNENQDSISTPENIINDETDVKKVSKRRKTK